MLINNKFLLNVMNFELESNEGISLLKNID